MIQVQNIMEISKVTEQGSKVDRRRVVIKKGIIVQKGKQKYRITDVVSFQKVVGVNLDNNRAKLLNIEDIMPVDDPELERKLSKDDSEIMDEHWEIAQRRYEIIRPIINSSSRTEIESIADKQGVHYTTIYNWLRAYKKANSISALIPDKRGWKAKKSRLPKKIEEVIDRGIKDFYLTIQKPSISKVVDYILAQCQKEGLDAPHPNSIRNRINNISVYTRLKHQGQKSLIQDKLSPAVKEFPGADYPLSFVQIDHTKLDIILVDEEYRQPLGRPWITLAIDVYSRVITGYYLSLDAPSIVSVGICASMSMLPKARKMVEYELDSAWEVWGIPESFHSDNGADFRTADLQRACLKYGINWEYRPIGGKQFGGHIERLIGSLNQEIHTLPGTTFSSIGKRGNYNSEKEAVFTFVEFEKWLLTWITKVYHNRKHSEINMTPLQKWEEGIWGTLSSPGIGLRDKPGDEYTLIIDFLPQFERTIQRHGVSIDSLRYYSDVLRYWISSRDQDGKIKSFIFKRDPRDISYIWFYEPELRQYFKIPTALQEIPSISLWEYHKVQKYLNDKNQKPSCQKVVYDAIYELREQTEQASKTTKATRRMQARKTLHEKSLTNLVSSSPIVDIEVVTDDLWSQDVESYEDLK